MRPQDAVLQHVRGLEGHDPPGQDRNLLTSLWVTADALVLAAHLEGGEGGELHGFAAHDRFADFVEHCLDKLSGLRPGKPDLSVYGFGEVGARKCLSPHPTRPTIEK